MDTVVQKRTRKDEEHQLVSGLKELIAKGPAKKQGGLIPDDTLKKVHLQRINRALERCQPDEWTEVKDPKETAKLREEFIVRALKRNVADLARRGVDLTLSQYRASVGL